MGRKKLDQEKVVMSIRIDPETMEQIRRIERNGVIKMSKIVEACLFSAVTLSYLDKQCSNTI